MAIQSYEDNQLAAIRPNYPEWDIWYVRSAIVRQTSWHARPVNFPVATLSADSPEQLIHKIALTKENDHA